LVFSKRQKLIGSVVGIVLAGAPMFAFNAWLNHFIAQQGQEQVDETGRHALAVAEKRAAQVIETLADLARRGVESCRPADLDALRKANFSTTPIKELSIVDPAGRTLCTDLGIPLGIRRLMFSQPLTAGGEVLIEVVRLGDQAASAIRIRRAAGGNANSLAALLPAELLLPVASMSAEAAEVQTLAVTTRDGYPLSERGPGPLNAANDKDRFVAAIQSQHYNLAATVTMPRDRVMAIHAHLHTVGTMITSVIALVIIGFALIVPARRRGDPVAEIERALKAGELIPYFQPVVDITSGRLRGCEVLVRWRKPDGSLVLPGTFVPVLESSGLIVEVTRAIMCSARDAVAAAYGSRPKLTLGFNLAAAHFADETIVRDVQDIFESSPIRLTQVVLELTERQPLENLTEVRRIIAALQGLGIVIAIDDVGTGHSGLSYMLKLGVDCIKIDKMFVDAIGTDSNSTTIIETLIDLARNMRMDLVAEGVESFEQVVLLRDLGIRAAQGYVFAPPLPASSYLQLIEAIDPLPQPALLHAGGSPVPVAERRSAA
jgi:sensor c-di-GMP phosphodiesterase-like protein